MREENIETMVGERWMGKYRNYTFCTGEIRHVSGINVITNIEYGRRHLKNTDNVILD